MTNGTTNHLEQAGERVTAISHVGVTVESFSVARHDLAVGDPWIIADYGSSLLTRNQSAQRAGQVETGLSEGRSP